MSDYSINKNRIAKNTMLLYCRMLFLMIVSLNTSRVILDALGVEDYGIYNAVAGFITMFSMISASISGAISRFITFVLGEGNQQKMNRVFCTALSTQFAIMHALYGVFHRFKMNVISANCNTQLDAKILRVGIVICVFKNQIPKDSTSITTIIPIAN